MSNNNQFLLVLYSLFLTISTKVFPRMLAICDESETNAKT